MSPASGRQVVSLYKMVSDDAGEPAGFVGGAIFTTGLVGTLDNLSLNGMESARYCMVNAAKKEYIFHPDKEKIATPVDAPYSRRGGKHSERNGYHQRQLAALLR